MRRGARSAPGRRCSSSRAGPTSPGARRACGNRVSHRFEVRAVNPLRGEHGRGRDGNPARGAAAAAGARGKPGRPERHPHMEQRPRFHHHLLGVPDRHTGRRGRHWDQVGWQPITPSSPTTVKHEIGSLVNGVRLAFAIRARNLVGAGGASETVFATPLSPVDMEITAGNIQVRTTSFFTLTATHPSVPREDEVWELRWRPAGQVSFGAWLRTEPAPRVQISPRREDRAPSGRHDLRHREPCREPRRCGPDLCIPGEDAAGDTGAGGSAGRPRGAPQLGRLVGGRLQTRTAGSSTIAPWSRPTTTNGKVWTAGREPARPQR